MTNTGRVADDNGIKSAANKDATDDAPLWYPQRAMVYEAEEPDRMTRLINFQKYIRENNLSNEPYVEEQEKLAMRRVG